MYIFITVPARSTVLCLYISISRSPVYPLWYIHLFPGRSRNLFPLYLLPDDSGVVEGWESPNRVDNRV
jgi:hypothetical protein